MAQYEGSGIGLILFMGQRIKHAITSIQKYVPEVVHIVTSDKFANQHKKRLKDWAKQFSFRQGTVSFVDDLFEESSVTSLLNEVLTIYRSEQELQENELDWHLGITGGTMNMAATGSYAGLLLGMKIFYVIQPPEDGKPMPNRDIIEFPQLQGLGWMLHLPLEIISFLGQESGEMGDFCKIIPEQVFRKLYESELVIIDGDKWFLTEEGKANLDFVKGTPIVSKMLDKLHNVDKIVDEISDSYVGWA